AYRCDLRQQRGSLERAGRDYASGGSGAWGTGSRAVRHRSLIIVDVRKSRRSVALFLPFRRTKQRQTAASAGTKRRSKTVAACPDEARGGNRCSDMGCENGGTSTGCILRWFVVQTDVDERKKAAE